MFSFLLSTEKQKVFIKDLKSHFHFEAWEPLFTEISMKYSPNEIRQLPWKGVPKSAPPRCIGAEMISGAANSPPFQNLCASAFLYSRRLPARSLKFAGGCNHSPVGGVTAYNE